MTWQRIRTAGGILPSTIAVTLADYGQAATEPEKVLVNTLRAAHRIVGILIRWLVASTSLFPASAVVTMFRLPTHRSTPRYGQLSRPQRINWSTNQNWPGVTDPGPRSGKIAARPGNRDPKINKLAESRDIAAARGSTTKPATFCKAVARSRGGACLVWVQTPELVESRGGHTPTPTGCTESTRARSGDPVEPTTTASAMVRGRGSIPRVRSGDFAARRTRRSTIRYRPEPSTPTVEPPGPHAELPDTTRLPSRRSRRPRRPGNAGIGICIRGLTNE